MEKSETKIRKKEETIHHFYCDGCNKYLGETEEYDDGWYTKLGEFELKFYVAPGWYEIDKCFCDKCRENFINKVKNTLIDLGFEGHENRSAFRI